MTLLYLYVPALDVHFDMYSDVVCALIGILYV